MSNVRPATAANQGNLQSTGAAVDRDVLESIPQAVLVLEGPRHTIVAANRRFFAVVGASSFDDLPPRVDTFIHPEDRNVFFALGGDGHLAGTVRILGDVERRMCVTAEFRGGADESQDRWVYFLTEGQDTDRLAEDVQLQKRITGEAVKTSMQMYYLADRIRSAPKLATLLVDSQDESTLLSRAGEFLLTEGFNCREVSVVLLDGDAELRLAFTTRQEVDGAGYFAKKRARYLAFLADGTQPRQAHIRLLPVQQHQRTVGVLELHFDPREFRLLEENAEVAAWHLDLLDTVGEIVSICLENIRLQEELKALTIRDAATGLYNRRFLLSQIRAEVKRAVRFDRDLSVIFMDLDGFKAINDTFGHNAGDRVLKELGAVLQGSVRESDFVCRYGGDEFVLILPELDVEGAYMKAEQLRVTVEEHDFLPVENRSSDLELTLSAGLASTQDTTSWKTLLELADKALYDAKRQGRNRVLLTEENAGS